MKSLINNIEQNKETEKLVTKQGAKRNLKLKRAELSSFPEESNSYETFHSTIINMDRIKGVTLSQRGQKENNQ